MSDLVALGPLVAVKQYDAAAAASLEALVDMLGDIALVVVIANAGVGGGPLRKAEAISRADWDEAIDVNTVALFLLAVRLRKNLEKGSNPKLVAISSLAASIRSGYAVQGQYVYRASKATLNALWRTLSVDLRTTGVTCLMMRPGRVKTRMTNFEGDLDVTQSVAGMKTVIDTATIADTGKFLGYDGAEVAW